jgi:hypothetical protein
MKGAHRLDAFAFIAVLAFARAAQGMIVYESGTSLDNTYNTSAPGNGSPWHYVAQVTNTDPSTNASAVYLGNGYLITAAHVTLNSSVVLDGTSYAINFSDSITSVGPDLKIFQIIGNPGLATLPLTSAATGTGDLNMNATMIGFGVGKASVITQSGSNAGFNWAGDTTYAERWGTNVTLSTYFTDSNSVLFLGTAYDLSLGVNVASASLGDSGSALFENFGGTWELAGIWDSVDTNGASYYADSPNNISGKDYSYAVEIEPYAAQIEADIPEPGSLALVGFGTVAVGFFAQRRRFVARRMYNR